MPSDEEVQTRGALEIRGTGSGLLDDELVLRVRGAGPGAALVWRARLRDDDGRVWRAKARRAEELTARWAPVKETTGDVTALQSLRPVAIEVRAEAEDGRAAQREFTRLLTGDGVRIRRWRDGLAATLYRPADETPAATVIVDATGSADAVASVTPAAALLASRGVLALVVGAVPAGADAEDALASARERLAAVPGASGDVEVLRGLPLPPGVGVRDENPAAATARAAAWDELLARLGARPRETAR